jgi:hypothetical protein
LMMRLAYGAVRLIGERPDEAHHQGSAVGIDLGVNALIAANDGRKVLLISGRTAKATTQYRNKRLARFQQSLSGKKQRWRRHRRLQRRKYTMVDQARRRVRDECHKATRQVATALPNATCYVGEAFTDAAQHIGRVQAQQVSTACTREITNQLSHQKPGTFTVCEAEASQDLSLPMVQGHWPARCRGGSQYPVALYPWHDAPRSVPAAAFQVSAPLASPAAQWFGRTPRKERRLINREARGFRREARHSHLKVTIAIT